MDDVGGGGNFDQDDWQNAFGGAELFTDRGSLASKSKKEDEYI